jgi:hypothetical protein
MATHLAHKRPSRPKAPKSPLSIKRYQLAEQRSDKAMSYAVELRFDHQGQELGIDRVQIALSLTSLKRVVEEYNEMGINFTRLAVMDESTGEKSEVVDLPGGKLTKKAKRIIYSAQESPRTIAVYGETISPLSGQQEGACLYVRSNYPID